jgi:SAM-dependent methyltransferase
MLPAVLARAVTSLRLRALDLADRALGRGDRLVPPRRLRGFAGDSDFLATGAELLSLLATHGELRDDSRVLDVGCGIGRLARTLTRVLDPEAGGAYVGFDPVAPAVAWCASRYPAHFRFVHADLRNDLYTPAGAVAATEYRFPVDDGWATLAAATSVFTHLARPEVDHYLAETSRALAHGGRALLTFFLLDDDSRAALAAGRARQRFAEPAGEQAIADRDVTMAAVAHDRASVLESLTRSGLEVAAVHDGTWRGGAGLSYQDLVVARAPARA